MGSKLIEHNGTFHMTIPAPLESPVGKESHSVINIFRNRLEVVGYGNVTSHTAVLVK
jgi:hypothetical protein